MALATAVTRGLILAGLVLLVAAAVVVAFVLHRRLDGTREQALADPPLHAAEEILATELPLTLPEGWNRSNPVPQKRTNCMRCHLTAGAS